MGRFVASAVFLAYALCSFATAHAQVSGTKILRPVPYEVKDRLVSGLAVTIYSPQVQTGVPVKLHDSTGAQVYSTAVNLAVGTNNLNIPRVGKMVPPGFAGSDLRKYFQITVGSGASQLHTKVAFGLLFVAAGQSNAAFAQCNSCPYAFSLPPNRMPMIPASGDPLVVSLSDTSNLLQIPNAASPGVFTNEPTSAADIASRIAGGKIHFEGLRGRIPGNHPSWPEYAAPGQADGRNHSIWYGVGKRLHEKLNMPVGFVIIGAGGTSVQQWVDTHKRRFHYGAPFSVTGILWHQGESDTYLGTSQSSYHSSLVSLITNVNSSAVGINAPWLISIASKYYDYSINTTSAAVVAAQQQVISTPVTGISKYAGPNTDIIPHNVHFDFGAEYEAYADAWYNSIRSSGVIPGMPQLYTSHPVNARIVRGNAPNGTYYLSHVNSAGVNPWTGETASAQFATGSGVNTCGLPMGVGNVNCYGAAPNTPMSFTQESMTFYVSDRFTSDYRIPLYQCKAKNQRNVFISPTPHCEDVPGTYYQHLGAKSLLGYAAATQVAGTVPLYRCHRVVGGELAHIVTTNAAAECISMWGFNPNAVEGLGYVRTAPLN